MKLIGSELMCTAIPEPRSWKMDGREGVTYKVDLSDGTNSLKIQCDGVDTYSKFRPFQRFDVTFDLQQTNYDGRTGVKALVIGAEMVE